MIKEDGFRIGLLSIVVLVGISIVYYFDYLLPIKAKQEQIHKLTIECMNIGERIALQDRPINEQSPFNDYYYQYFYNPKFNQCYFYEDAIFVGKTHEYFKESIMEAYTHSVIYSRQCQDGSTESRCLPGSEFDKRKCELFAEKC
jgi:hypothetical protein